MSPRRALAFAVALAFITPLAACSGGKKGPAGPFPIAVDTAPAKQQDIATYLRLDGQISPFLESSLALPQSGTLVAVYATEGERVRKGQLLAKLDDSTLRANLASAQAQVAANAAKASGSGLQIPITQQSTSSQLVTTQSSLQQARKQLTADQASLQNAQLVYNQNAQLNTQGYVSQTATEQARANYVAAQQKVAADQAAIRTAEAAVQAAQQNLGTTQIQQQTNAQDRAAVAQAQANVALYQAQIAQSALYAPFDGVITQRTLDPGAFASGNAPIMRISQIDPVYVNANVPDEALGYVRAGTPVTFTTSSIPGRVYRGTVDSVNATPTQGTLSYRARLKQPNPDNTLRGGMLVTINVRKEFHPDAIVVPRTSVQQSDQGSSVYIVVDGDKPGPTGQPSKVAKQIPVQVGLTTDVLAEVRSSEIKPGTTVITTKPDTLQSGSLVMTGPPPGAGGPGGGPGGAGGGAAGRKGGQKTGGNG